jgi:hypothetical protein
MRALFNDALDLSHRTQPLIRRDLRFRDLVPDRLIQEVVDLLQQGQTDVVRVVALRVIRINWLHFPQINLGNLHPNPSLDICLVINFESVVLSNRLDI